MRNPKTRFLMFAGVVLGVVFPGGLSAALPRHPGPLSLDERVAYQRAIEEVFWRHRLWPDENTMPKPPLEAVLSSEQIRAKVEDGLRLSNAQDHFWGQPITGDQLQAEIKRQAAGTQQPEVLQELWAALANDPYVIAEMLARPALAERLARSRYTGAERTDGTDSGQPPASTARPDLVGVSGSAAGGLSFEGWWQEVRGGLAVEMDEPDYPYHLPEIAARSQLQDTWTPTHALPEANLETTAVWTGSEMIIWGGTEGGLSTFNSGSRYNPATDTWRSTSGVSAPYPRKQHSAVWTGTEMIVWGGCGLLDEHSCMINSGGRYNPLTDTWLPTSQTNAASARMNHTAVWTGSEMVVYGGCSFSNNVCRPTNVGSTGGRYDPATDTWQPTNTANAPGPRHFHTAVWTGTTMIVWGGEDGIAALNTGGRYDPSSDSWQATASLLAQAARYDHTAVWTGSRMIFWGGTNGSQSFNTGAAYDPAANTWQLIRRQNAPSARAQHTAVWTGSEMIVWGGLRSFTSFNTGGRYNPASNTWAPTSSANAPDARSGHLAVWTDAQMIVWGGAAAQGGNSRTGGRYDPVLDTWTPTNANETASAREAHTAIWTGAEMIIWGGDDRFSGTVNTGSRYTLATDSWQPTPGTGSPSARRSHTAVWTGLEMIIWGGQYGSTITQTGRRYDPIANIWTPTTTSGAPAARGSHSAVWTGMEMIVWGGAGQTSPWLDTGGRYDPVADSWVATTTVNAPTARSGPAAIWMDLGAPVMIVWGGTGATGPVKTGARYDPGTNTWSAIGSVDAPSARTSFAAVWTGSEMVVWGGWNFMTGQYFQTGGRYDPANDSWTATNLTGAPEARAAFAQAWTGTELIVWGGNDADGEGLYTGGRYDPAADTWTPTSVAGAPGRRSGPSGVWTGQEMIAWGGISGDSSTYTLTGGRYSPGTP